MPEYPCGHPSLITDRENTIPGDQVSPHFTRISAFSEKDTGLSIVGESNWIEHTSHILSQENAILCGDAITVLRMLPDEYFSCCITSPPYWESRHSGLVNRLGAEQDPYDYIRNMVQIFREVRRTLTPSGTLWLVIGDCYATDNQSWWETYQKIALGNSDNNLLMPTGFKVNDTMGIPWRLAIELQRDGWYFRSDIIWSIPNQPVGYLKDRPARVHNYVFLLAKSERHLYNTHGLENASKRTVWEIPNVLKSPIEYTVFPEPLVERCMKAGSHVNDVVLDPFFGSGTVGLVAKRLKRRYVGIDIDPRAITIAGKRIRGEM